MKKMPGLLIGSIIAVAALFASAGIYATAVAPDDIKMENKAYSGHTRSIVTFSHQKHSENYPQKAPDLFKEGCGACHHDESGKPLSSLKPGDPVQGCIECHSTPGEKPKGKDQKKLTRQEELAYHAEAIHDTCRGCHRTYNRNNNLKIRDPGAAPTTCTQCHS